MATSVGRIERELLAMGKSMFLKLLLFGILISYFYNVAVFKYSITGSNELRLYDFLGMLVIYKFVENLDTLLWFINRKRYLQYLWIFIKWSLFMMIFTFLISYINGRLTWILRTVLFMYHFITFYFSFVFFLILMRNVKILRQFVYLYIIMAIIATLVVLGQHFGVIGYLWSDIDRKSYGGFLSGILGPNKIVLGMVMMTSLITFIGLFLEKNLKINRLFLLGGILFAIIALSLSGSRTSYVGLLIFALYFFVKSTGKFLYISFFVGAGLLAVAAYNSEIFSIITDVFNGRVINKLSDPSLIAEGDIDGLYEDLGAGRKNLSVKYINYLLTHLYIVPFGSGFNNFILIGNSAHNIYLTLINEVGLVGLYFYVRWLLNYFTIDYKQFKNLGIAMKGLVLAMMVTLLFGEHLYVYRPVFAILGLFLFSTAVLITPRYYKKV
ncbi:hypothetical protein [uncultured Kordia sp.]|uniref:hypothetical protein n=1 Tax=uncultured Kordia sp. TaxID=507699 RepID=UPI00260BC13D|nr:hypothetical protein [uncultured Kordia sp.]